MTFSPCRARRSIFCTKVFCARDQCTPPRLIDHKSTMSPSRNTYSEEYSFRKSSRCWAWQAFVPKWISDRKIERTCCMVMRWQPQPRHRSLGHGTLEPSLCFAYVQHRRKVCQRYDSWVKNISIDGPEAIDHPRAASGVAWRAGTVTKTPSSCHDAVMKVG